jgi:hypothetical protein
MVINYFSKPCKDSGTFLTGKNQCKEKTQNAHKNWCIKYMYIVVVVA